jgi:hypothetical protein
MSVPARGRMAVRFNKRCLFSRVTAELVRAANPQRSFYRGNPLKGRFAVFLRRDEPETRAAFRAEVGLHIARLPSTGGHHCPRWVRTPSTSAALIREDSGIPAASAAASISSPRFGPLARCARSNLCARSDTRDVSRRQ